MFRTYTRVLSADRFACGRRRRRTITVRRRDEKGYLRIIAAVAQSSYMFVVCHVWRKIRSHVGCTYSLTHSNRLFVQLRDNVARGFFFSFTPNNYYSIHIETRFFAESDLRVYSRQAPSELLTYAHVDLAIETDSVATSRLVIEVDNWLSNSWIRDSTYNI